MNKEVIARIDVSTPEGRRIVRELEKEDSVKIEYPESEEFSGKEWYTVEEVFSRVEEKLNKHYGTNYKLKY